MKLTSKGVGAGRGGAGRGGAGRGGAGPEHVADSGSAQRAQARQSSGKAIFAPLSPRTGASPGRDSLDVSSEGLCAVRAGVEPGKPADEAGHCRLVFRGRALGVVGGHAVKLRPKRQGKEEPGGTRWHG